MNEVSLRTVVARGSARAAKDIWRGDPFVARLRSFVDLSLPELQALIPLDADHKNITLDLEELRLVDREAVGYLAACEAIGIELRNCPAYVRKWLNARSDTRNEQ